MVKLGRKFLDSGEAYLRVFDYLYNAKEWKTTRQIAVMVGLSTHITRNRLEEIIRDGYPVQKRICMFYTCMNEYRYNGETD
jgi:hypothetical protein